MLLAIFAPYLFTLFLGILLLKEFQKRVPNVNFKNRVVLTINIVLFAFPSFIGHEHNMILFTTIFWLIGSIINIFTYSAGDSNTNKLNFIMLIFDILFVYLFLTIKIWFYKLNIFKKYKNNSE